MINEAKRSAKEQDIAASRFEFQMLYGVRRDLQERLVTGGLSDARLRAVRHAVVSVPDAPPRRASRERRVHHGQRRPRRRCEIAAALPRLAAAMPRTARFPARSHRGDANTIGGYTAVHGRPAAFEGADGFSYSVEIVTSTDGRRRSARGARICCSCAGRASARSRRGSSRDGLPRRGRHRGGGARRRRRAGRSSAVQAAARRARRDIAAESAPRRWWDAMRDERGDEEDAK